MKGIHIYDISSRPLTTNLTNMFSNCFDNLVSFRIQLNIAWPSSRPAQAETVQNKNRIR